MKTLTSRIEIVQGDITKLNTDAIVNAANSSLLGGGGVDGAIHRAGGPEILEACKKIVEIQGGCQTGEAVITTAGKLPSRFIIHTVGPVWRGGKNDEQEKLASCYINSLQLAVINDCQSVAFPNISTGVYGFPKVQAARIAVNTVSGFLSKNNRIEKVIFVCFDEENYRLIKEQLNVLSMYS
ncbi:O-acetyl-ADP-ribose deacetylase (regulator of RNase III), contains Macro domain [Dyadobacter koreensis]|uniref:O-acetyl-ADP-ribose deacetylase (Regulator of RNase III), contains Macro domain n=1 Tax=Dyadobacter koreensis TaxID=408657 RepID=A0A1H7B2X9_9BACT|nr:O-acetyl-ADP-ribose deacetylase [Dyadobacter koreensis]SEJ72103.1 O-acetyl-ADP-ribose deacetylase (regulator of RNase III), contains Macro domain [Dyadobacter koreensis]